MEVVSNALKDTSSITEVSVVKLMHCANSLMPLLVFANPAILDIRSVPMEAAYRLI